MIATAPTHCRVEKVTCCVCGRDATDPDEVAQGFDFEYESTHDTFHMVRCSACGLVYLNPRPTPDELSTIYPANYYAYHYQSEVHPLARAAKNMLDNRKIDRWLAQIATQHPRFLDVGCGDGRHLIAMHKRGLPKEQLWGIELDKEVVDKLRAAGYQAHHGRIEEVSDLPSKSFDLIVMLQVIEHVADPSACIGRLASLLDDDGVIVLETPNVRSLDQKIFKNRYWGGYHFPRHWNLFDETTLTRLLGQHGLEPISIRFLPAPSFWIYSLQHIMRYRYGFPRLANFLNPFRNLPLQALFTSFDMARAALGLRTSNMQIIARRCSNHRA